MLKNKDLFNDGVNAAIFVKFSKNFVHYSSYYYDQILFIKTYVYNREDIAFILIIVLAWNYLRLSVKAVVVTRIDFEHPRNHDSQKFDVKF